MRKGDDELGQGPEAAERSDGKERRRTGPPAGAVRRTGASGGTTGRGSRTPGFVARQLWGVTGSGKTEVYLRLHQWGSTQVEPLFCWCRR